MAVRRHRCRDARSKEGGRVVNRLVGSPRAWDADGFFGRVIGQASEYSKPGFKLKGRSDLCLITPIPLGFLLGAVDLM